MPADDDNSLTAEPLLGALKLLLGEICFVFVCVSALLTPSPNVGKTEGSAAEEKSSLDITLRSRWPGEGLGSLLDADVTDRVTGLGGVWKPSIPASCFRGDVKSSLEIADDDHAGRECPSLSTHSRRLGERWGVRELFLGVVLLLVQPLGPKREASSGDCF